jgi:hypothetical protein
VTHAPLVCPECAAAHGDDERFCARCGMPLVYADGAQDRLSERQQRARKIKPQYAQGGLVRVVWTRNQAEAELLGGMLLAEGIPSLMRRPAGFDVPDFMAAGPRELLVARSALEAARDVLLQNDAGAVAAPPVAPAAAVRRPARMLALLLLAVVALAVVLFMATHAWD